MEGEGKGRGMGRGEGEEMWGRGDWLRVWGRKVELGRRVDKVSRRRWRRWIRFHGGQGFGNGGRVGGERTGRMVRVKQSLSFISSPFCFKTRVKRSFK